MFVLEDKKQSSKISNWVDSYLYKEARKISIDLDMTWRKALEEALKLFIEKYK